jgi:hypothetical protein
MEKKVGKRIKGNCTFFLPLMWAILSREWIWLIWFVMGIMFIHVKEYIE